MIEREHHIKVLENLLSHYKAREKCEGYYDSTLKDNVEALQYAISSLKTDEAYQIMYEGGEIFTKTDMVAMLTDIQLEIEELDVSDVVPEYQDGADETRDYIADLLQQKIDALKGEQEAADGKD